MCRRPAALVMHIWKNSNGHLAHKYFLFVNYQHVVRPCACGNICETLYTWNFCFSMVRSSVTPVLIHWEQAQFYDKGDGGRK